MSAAAIDSFYVDLFFKGDIEGAKKFEAEFEVLKGKAFNFAAVLTGVTAGLFAFVGGIAHGMGELNDFAETNDLAVDSVAALGKAAMVADVGMDAVKASLQGLQSITGEAALGVGRGAMIFQKLGLSAKDSSGHVRDAFEMLTVIADKIQNLPRPEQLAYLQKLRIDPNMVKMLKAGGESLKEMIDEAKAGAVIDKQYYEQADRIDKKFKRVANGAGLYLKMIGVRLFEGTEKVLDYILKWQKSMREDMKKSGVLQWFKLLGDAIGRMPDLIESMLAPLKDLKKWLDDSGVSSVVLGGTLFLMTTYGIGKFFIGAAEAAKGLAMALMGVNAAGAGLAIAVGAVVLALFLLWDEFETAKKGGDSLIGRFNSWLDTLGPWGDAIKGILKGVAYGFAIWGTAAALAWMATLGPIAAGLVGLGLIIAWFWGFRDTIKDCIKWVTSLWDKLFGGGKAKKVEVTKETKEVLDSAATMSKAGKSGWKPSTSVGGVEYGPNATGGMLGVAERSLSTQSNQSNATTTVNAPITINGATDPQAVGAEVQRRLEQQTRSATRDSQSTVY